MNLPDMQIEAAFETIEFLLRLLKHRERVGALQQGKIGRDFID